MHNYYEKFINFTGPPTVPMNIRFPDMDITGESFVVQWDAVDDTFPVNYAVRWYRGNDLIDMARVDGLSYTVTNLTANTSYTVTVVAVNTCCGQGQVSIVGMVMTNDEPPTSPTPTNTTTVITPSATPTSTPGKILLLCNSYTILPCIVHAWFLHCFN